jgi:hypothetical protein
MRVSRWAWSRLFLPVLLLGVSPAAAQVTGGAAVNLPPGGLGSLTQSDIALSLRTPDVEVRFVPLDPRLGRLLARDAWQSLRSLVESRRKAIDSVANRAGVSRPGLALVTFYGQQPNARFDPQTLTVMARSREFRPLGIVPFSGRFNSQQINVREQASAIYLFEEDLPVNDTFTVLYAGQSSDDWQGKQLMLDRERARVASRERAQRDTAYKRPVPSDSTLGDGAPADSVAADSAR